MGREIAGLQQHPDGYEKDAGEIVPEREDVGNDAVAVLGFRDDETGQERAERQREAEAVSDPCRAMQRSTMSRKNISRFFKRMTWCRR